MSDIEVINEELVRCRPCGYVMKKSDLDKVGVCPACGLPHTVFEPYREKVSTNRLRILDIDLHPIIIHVSQTFVAFIPLLLAVHLIAPNFNPVDFVSIIKFSILIFPLTLIGAFISGIIDGLTRFKTLDTPLLKSKIYYSIAILLISIVMFVKELVRPEDYTIIDLILASAALFFAVKLGRMGKQLLNVILPGKYQRRKKTPKAKAKA